MGLTRLRSARHDRSRGARCAVRGRRAARPPLHFPAPPARWRWSPHRRGVGDSAFGVETSVGPRVQGEKCDCKSPKVRVPARQNAGYDEEVDADLASLVVALVRSGVPYHQCCQADAVYDPPLISFLFHPDAAEAFVRAVLRNEPEGTDLYRRVLQDTAEPWECWQYHPYPVNWSELFVTGDDPCVVIQLWVAFPGSDLAAVRAAFGAGDWLPRSVPSIGAF